MKVSMFVSISLLSLLVASSSSSSVSASPVTCSSEGVQCGYNETSLLEAVMQVEAVQYSTVQYTVQYSTVVVMQVEAVAECRQLCLARADCGYISYYGEAAAPVSHFCLLLSSCATVTPCSGCVSERRSCFETCSSAIVGDLDQSLASLPSVQSEVECKEACLETLGCSVYTYFTQD